MAIPPNDPAQMPILGEPLPVELANRLYVAASGVVDFLGTADLVRSWFAHAPAAATARCPVRLTRLQVEDVRELRTAVRCALDAAVTGSGSRPRDVATLNRHAGASSCRVQLEWSAGGTPRQRVVHVGTPIDVLLAHLACAAIALLTGPDLTLLHRCEHLDCEMLFVQQQQHHRRRFCSAGCSHRFRQYRYYRTKASDHAVTGRCS